MPIIAGYYVRKSSLRRDVEFLKSKGLSDDQIANIQPYFYRRLQNTAVAFMIIGPILAATGVLASEFDAFVNAAKLLSNGYGG